MILLSGIDSNVPAADFIYRQLFFSNEFSKSAVVVQCVDNVYTFGI